MGFILKRRGARVALFLSATAIASGLAGACSAPPAECDEESGACFDAGAPPPDVCNSREEALKDAQCQLTLGQAKTGYISFSGDQDWYAGSLPSGLTPKSLVHLAGAYAVPNTPVNLTLNLLREDGQTSLARRIDRHGQGAPRPVDIILPFADFGTRLLVLVSDEGATSAPRFDVRSPYSVMLEVIENPDVNEPNDATPTVLTLSPQGAALTGQQSGFLATEDDVDRFSVSVPAGRKVLYLHLTTPKPEPVANYRLSYVLLDGAGKQVSEGQVDNEFLPVDLATARLSTSAATWTVVVQGFRSPNNPGPVAGDLKLKYTLDVSVFDEVDVTEPNDTVGTARALTLSSPGTSQTVTARLGYVPDIDWFNVQLPALASPRPTRLRYRLVPSGTAGRFPPLAAVSDLQVRLVKQVTTGATAQDRQVACRTNGAICPKGYEGTGPSQQLVDSLCLERDPPQCLLSERNEHARFPRFSNAEGIIPVPASATATSYLLAVQDDGNNYADDKSYELTVQWLEDADESARAALPAETHSAALAASGFPEPGGAGERSGELTHGFGRLLRLDPNQGQSVRGPVDYDAVPTDADRFEFTFPPELADGGVDGGTDDLTWTLQWELAHLPDGGVPAQLALEVEFCNGDSAAAADGGCASRKNTLAYSGDRLEPWYSSAQQDRVVQWTKEVEATRTTVTAAPAGCFCFEPRFVRGGRFYVTVLAADRTSYEPLSYRLRSGYTSYPQSYSGDGGTRACPVAATPPSCRFTR